MTPREFASLPDAQARQIAIGNLEGTLWAPNVAAFDLYHIRNARPPKGTHVYDVVLVATEDDWNIEVSAEIRAVWQPRLPQLGEHQFLVVTRIEEPCGTFSKPQHTRLYPAAKQVFMSLPPAGYWDNDLPGQVVAIRAWCSGWEDDHFDGPAWTVDQDGRWTLTSETSGRRFHVWPTHFAVDLDASITAAAEVCARLTGGPDRDDLRFIDVTVAAGSLADDGGVDVVPGTEMPWPATIGQLVAALNEAVQVRDRLRYREPEPAVVLEDDEEVDLTEVFVPPFDVDEAQPCDS